MMHFPPVEVNGRSLDVKVISTENRNAYARFRKGSIIISIPSSIQRESAHSIALGLYTKIKNDIIAKPDKYLSYEKNDRISFKDNDKITVMGRGFGIHISYSNTKAARGTLRGSEIFINVPDVWISRQKDDAVSSLARRIISKAVEKEIKERVNAINSQHFNSSIKDIRITNASTRWGSCTTRSGIGNASIALNFKLLFMPERCLDYVIVHELAHTKIHNHSDGFWGIVGSIMPDYKEYKRMLKESAYSLNYSTVQQVHEAKQERADPKYNLRNVP